MARRQLLHAEAYVGELLERHRGDVQRTARVAPLAAVQPGGRHI
jgi:hypothetical protein